MKRPNLIFGLTITVLISILLSLHLYKSNSSTLENFNIINARIIKIASTNSHDIVFYDDHAARYYITNDIENELNLDSLNVKVLNKTVTLRLEKLVLGTSNSITQLAIDDKIIFTKHPSKRKTEGIK